MKNIVLFDKHKDFETFYKGSDFAKPHLSYCKEEKCVHYNILFYADDDYNARFLNYCYNHGLTETNKYMTIVEARNIGLIYLKYSDNMSIAELEEITDEHPNYVWYSNRGYWESSAYYTTSSYACHCRFGMNPPL